MIIMIDMHLPLLGKYSPKYIKIDDREEQNKKDLEKLEEIYGEDEIFYKKLPGTKKSKIKVSSLINEMTLVEFEKCQNDPFYFIETYCYIDSKDHGTIQFKLRSFQREIIEKALSNRFVLVKIGRQLGKTLCFMALFLWFMLFHENKSILCFANSEDLSFDHLKLFKFMYEKLPLWMKEGVLKYNEKSVKFENGSTLKSRLASKSAGRGGTNDIVFGDEMGIIEEKIMVPWLEGAFPTIESSTKTSFFGASTPNGYNTFWRMFTEGINGINGFISLQYPWNIDGIRGETFKQNIIKKFGLRYWEKEFEAKFIGSSSSLLSSAILEKMTTLKPLREHSICGSEHKLKIYKEVIKGHSYVVTGDPSEGLGEDSDDTGLIVWDITETNIYEQVAVLDDNTIDSDDAPFIYTEVCRMYNNALCINEINLFPDIPKHMVGYCDYDNIFQNEKGNYGQKMVEPHRSIGLARMRKEFELGRVIVYDCKFIHQISQFGKNKNGKYEGADGCHDDLVTSANLLFWLISSEERFKRYISDKINYRKDVKNMDVEDEELDIILDNGLIPHHALTHKNYKEFLKPDRRKEINNITTREDLEDDDDDDFLI